MDVVGRHSQPKRSDCRARYDRCHARLDDRNHGQGHFSASGTTRVSLKQPPPPPPPPPTYSELGQCTSFKRNNARVDNACKEILQNRVIPALQADPTARLVIDGYRAENEKPANLDLQRAKTV